LCLAAEVLWEFQMKKQIVALAIATALVGTSFANGGGVVIAPPPAPVPAPAPAPAPVPVVAQQQQPWFLYVLGAAALVGIIIALSDDDSSP
jgi:hypothetical protein